MNVLLSLALAIAPAAAGSTVRVAIDPAVAARLDVPALARALGEELDVAVLLDGDAPARVTVRADHADAVVLRYEDDAGAVRERSVALPDEPAESTRVVVLLVATLARDQVGDLVEPEGAPVEEAPASTPAGTAARPRRGPSDRDVHVGIGVTGGGAPTSAGTVEPFFVWGAELGWRVAPRLKVGLARMSFGFGGSSSDPSTVAAFVRGTPHVEVSGFAGERLEPFGRAGVLVRGKTESSRDAGWFEAAPYLGGGARLHVTPAIAFGLEVGVNLVVTEGLTLGSAALPRWSVPGSFGATTTFHF
ncbi:MAG: hypothetical protein ACK4YP_12365 [Myxococcota bacterium]